MNAFQQENSLSCTRDKSFANEHTQLLLLQGLEMIFVIESKKIENLIMLGS